MDIEKSFQLRAEGKLTDGDLAFQHQRLALERHPESKTVGEALNKLYSSEYGKQVLKSATSARFYELQRDNAIGDGYAAVLKLNEHAQTQPNRDDDQDSDGDENGDDDQIEEPFNLAVKRLMRKHGISFDAAAARLMRRAAAG